MNKMKVCNRECCKILFPCLILPSLILKELIALWNWQLCTISYKSQKEDIIVIITIHLVYLYLEIYLYIDYKTTKEVMKIL